MIEAEAPAKGPLFLAKRQASAVEIAVCGVAKVFRKRHSEVVALDGISFTQGPREVLGVVGPSGCGKSTLLELIAGLDEPSAGEIVVAGDRRAPRRLDHCALMPQRDLLLPWRSALDNACLALELNGSSRAEARRGALPLFERFGLAEFTTAPPYELSGGMRQRVAFVRTLLTGKPVLLLDEPFGSLDSITRADMQEWLAAALRDEPHTVVLVTHDVEEALFLCDRVLVLSPRPGSVRLELDVPTARTLPRHQTVTSGQFVELKEKALEALS